MKKFSILIAVAFLIISCNNQKESININSEDYHAAVDKLTSIMIHDVFSPPVASRIYAYPFIASYQTLNYNSDVYKNLSGQLNGLNDLDYSAYNENVNPKLAALIAYLDVAKEVIFSKKEMEKYRDSLYSVWEKKNKVQFTNSKKYATSISKQIMKWMSLDNYKETRNMPKFNINSNDPSRWQPTPPAYMDGIEPHWNKIRPFVLSSASEFKPKKHPEFSLKKNSDFYKELMEVYQIKKDMEKVGDSSEKLTIAQFWDCNPYVSVNRGHFMFASKKITPGAHWIGICKIATRKDKSDFAKTIFAYTKTSIAIVDGFISCWDEKYRSNLIRPETLINKLIDKDWKPVLQTPPFPEYTSGHSVVSGAASEVLTSIFGDNFQFDDDTEVPYNLPVRKFNSFRLAAKEAAISRLYGGIHYMAAIKNGLDQGIKVGQKINNSLQLLQ